MAIKGNGSVYRKIFRRDVDLRSDVRIKTERCTKSRAKNCMSKNDGTKSQNAFLNLKEGMNKFDGKIQLNYHKQQNIK